MSALNLNLLATMDLSTTEPSEITEKRDAIPK